MALYTHLTALWHLHTLISNPDGLTLEEVETASKGLDAVVTSGYELLPSVYNKPNGHNLIELVKHDLPLLRSVHFTGTDAWERMHAYGKRESAHCPDIGNWSSQEALTLAMHGTPWYLDTEERKLSLTLRSIVDYRAGYEDKLSPLVAMTSSVLKSQETYKLAKGLEHNGFWEVSTFVQTDSHRKRKGQLDEAFVKGMSFFNVFAFMLSYPTSDIIYLYLYLLQC